MEKCKIWTLQGKFYMDISDIIDVLHNIPVEKIKNKWSKMWVIDDNKTNKSLLDKYVLKYLNFNDENIWFFTMNILW